MSAFDVAVIGAGPGGYVAAIRASQCGLRTVLVERDLVGGTCLQRGCIPTKALLEAAERYEAIRKAGRFGISVSDIHFDYAKAAARKDRVVLRLTRGIQQLLEQHGVQTLKGSASFVDPHTLRVGEEQVTAASIIVATGSRPIRLPGFEGENILSSDELLGLKTLPQRLVILGGGVIGMEFACLYAGLGCGVTIVEKLPRLLPGFDSAASQALREVLEKRGVVIHTGATALSALEGELVFEKEGQPAALPYSHLLVAVGRRPNTEDLRAELGGLALERGYVRTDASLRTNVPHIFAIGDVTGRSSLAHAASSQAFVAVEGILGKTAVWDDRFVPACIYSSPEIAGVGLNREQAQAQGLNVQIGSFPLSMNGKAMIMEEGVGMTELICDRDSGRLLGGLIMAPRATDMIGELCLALRMGAGCQDIGQTIHPHPTLVEMLMEAAHSVSGECVHL